MDAAGERRKAPGVEALPGVWVYPDAQALAQAAATRFVRLASEFAAREGKFAVALAGGSTPVALFRRLASEPVRATVPWEKVQVFWGDERPVPPGDSQSNYGMARRELLSRVSVPPQNIHRMEADAADLGAAARAYEELLRQHLQPDAHGVPRFHLVLLGLGEDGHTASLFPNGNDVAGTARWVATPLVEKLGARRMTLTLPVLNAAHHVVFLVAGEEKAEALRGVVEEKDPRLPAARVSPHDGERVFLADAAAARLLRGGGR